MKRSRSLSLIVMGTLALSASGCGEQKIEEELHAFSSISECVSSGAFTETECYDFARQAVAQSPSFTSKAECEAQFGEGNCEASSSSSGRSPWMPILAGYMAGRFLSGGSMMQNSQGLYRDRSGANAFRTANGEGVKTDARGRVTNPSTRLTQSMSHNAKPAVARGGSGSRGGFSGSGRSASS